MMFHFAELNTINPFTCLIVIDSCKVLVFVYFYSALDDAGLIGLVLNFTDLRDMAVFCCSITTGHLIFSFV